MGIEDRDWYRDAQREREKQSQLNETRARFADFSRRQPGIKVVSPTRTGLIPMMVFWCVVMALLYGAMNHYLKPKQVEVLANGDLVIHRSHDGHFYTLGTINGREVKFLVDTGASLVSVSEAFAQKALIRGGVSTTFRTANGDRLGRVVEGVGVSIGPVSLTNVRVGVGISASDENDALLGQSFLSKFDIAISKNQMVLRSR
ncbi:retropepsin-like aspartic protease family protein [Rhodoferax sp.]|uniref:retropepsin-like aspartic protease family protein n=1 Tax=Rhodoferax sp. TaxID=50421 RepID=UPI00273096A5|nr:retropepsin-like aspartic protease [Rhodoferax sp.]MDP1531424.1 retropepsin-like aspartic protease [Rhodoferax sp.]MDP1944108.1 retropepsin-like aspartic protease [Rhodoferax sp.]MDP2441998.1 retropepsin-like aspartic protease [Rhodoferax sp.]MDP3190441.1 retropepsin-like aspartic protease [Rhodoferax sp.]MDP3338252.1 retropepsin-like aspartic protease [Rhodoferax sp.]